MANKKGFLLGLILLGLFGCAGPAVKNDGNAEAAKIGKPGELDLGDDVANVMYDVMLAEIAADRGDLDTAADYYYHAAVVSRDPDIAERAAKVANFVKKEEKALEAALIWREGKPDSTEASQLITVLYLRTGKYELARTELDKILAETEADRLGGAFLQIGALFQREVPSQEMFTLMSHYLTLYPDVPEVSYVAATSAVAIDDNEKALEWINMALKKDSSWDDAVLLRSQILASLDRQDEAMDYLRGFLERHPTENRVRMAYARLLINAKKLEEARNQFELLAVKLPENEDVLFALAMLSIEFSDYDEAEGYLMQLVDMGKQTPQISYYLGQIAEQQKNDEAALDWYSKVPEGEFYLDAQLRIAMVLARAKSVEEALTHLHNIPVSSPQEERERLLLEGNLLRDAGRYEEAYELYSDALEDDPEDVNLLFGRSLVSERLGDVDDAIKDLRFIVSKHPDNAAYLNALGYTLADRTDKHEEALELLQKAIDLKPNDPAIVDSMGWIQYRMGNLEVALEYLQRSLDLHFDAEVAAHLGEVLWKLGRLDEAREIWNKAAESQGDNPVLQKTMKRFLNE